PAGGTTGALARARWAGAVGDGLRTGSARPPVGRGGYNPPMLIRALIVLLLVLNVGVALWWALREPAPEPSPAASPTVARLQLAEESIAPGGARAVPPPAPVVVTQCHSFGPFVDQATLEKAQARLQP